MRENTVWLRIARVLLFLGQPSPGLVPALAVLCTSAGTIQAQFEIRKDQPDLPIDAAKRTEVIEALLKRVQDDYVLPEVGEKMAQAVRERLANKEYDAIRTGQELAKRLTADLQAVSKDKHLRMLCSTAKLPPRPNEGKPNAEELERRRALTKKRNAGFQKVERLPGNVGYLELLGFMDDRVAAGPAAAAMNFLADTDALIIDLRRNGGGSPHTVALVCSYLFDEKPVHLNDLYWRKGDRTDEFWTLKELPGKRYLGKDVYVLTSSRTFSGAEEFTYNLKNLKRATIVGETTGGGANPGGSVPIDDHFVVFIPTGRAINPITKANWEGTGVTPDVPVSADKALEMAHELAVKKLLEKAPDEETRRLIRMDVEASKEKTKGKKD